MNDLTYVMCNLKLTSKKKSRSFEHDFDEIHSDDEWINDGVTDEVGLVEEDNVDESLQSHGIDENMENSIFDVNLNADFNVTVEDIREKYNNNVEIQEANGDKNTEGGEFEEFEDIEDDENLSFDRLF